jgi:predicted nucleic acid-binding protein
MVLHRLGRDAASDWLTDMADAALVNPTPEDYRQALARIAALADQPITLFDATVAALATRLKLEVWTYDHHFDVMRVGVWR